MRIDELAQDIDGLGEGKSYSVADKGSLALKQDALRQIWHCLEQLMLYPL